MYLLVVRFTRLFIPKAFFLLCSQLAFAQDHIFGGWTAWFNTARFSEKWGMNNDIQFRFGKDWSSNSMLLIRPGVNYHINARQIASVGYAASVVTNQLSQGMNSVGEHRIWEQYIITGRVIGVPVQHRFRLEQRFLMRTETVFAQRVRYFIRGIIPLQQPLAEPLTRGGFISVQNELFFNIQHKSALNGSLFDQNRVYMSMGYRFSRRYDLEAGYMNQFLLRGASPNTAVHIAQIAFYSRL